MKLLSLRSIRESGRQKLFIIPCLFTFANAFLGFCSVIQALEGNFLAAAYLIVLAVLMDFLDGRLARALASSSSFGMELDSLSDAISFCFAPAVLLYSWKLNQAGPIGIVVLGVYLCAGLLRLAKFNVISWEQGTVDFFVGLPTTSAAFFLIQLVLYENWIQGSFFAPALGNASLLTLVALFAFLMISPLRFPTFKRVAIFTKPLYAILFVFSFLIFTFLLFKGVPVFLLGLLAYVCSGIIISSADLFKSILSR